MVLDVPILRAHVRAEQVHDTVAAQSHGHVSGKRRTPGQVPKGADMCVGLRRLQGVWHGGCVLPCPAPRDPPGTSTSHGSCPAAALSARAIMAASLDTWNATLARTSASARAKSRATRV